MAPLDNSPYLDRAPRTEAQAAADRIAAACRAVVIPDSSPYAFPQRLKAPRGLHPCGHVASLVWLLSWASQQPKAFARDDLGWNADALRALEDCIRNGYVERAGGGAIPAAYGHPSVRFVVSAAGRELLARARAAEQGRAAA